jgi:hypothetical protein
MFALPSAPFLTSATESAYDTPFYALAGGGGGSNLPPGTNGAYLFNDGSVWKAQTNPVILGTSDADVSCVAIGQNNNIGGATNSFVVGNGNSFSSAPDSSVALGDNIAVSVNNAIAIGSYASVNGDSGIAIGVNATVGDTPQGVSIGANAGHPSNTKNATINIGQSA